MDLRRIVLKAKQSKLCNSDQWMTDVYAYMGNLNLRKGVEYKWYIILLVSYVIYLE